MPNPNAPGNAYVLDYIGIGEDGSEHRGKGYAGMLMAGFAMRAMTEGADSLEMVATNPASISLANKTFGEGRVHFIDRDTRQELPMTTEQAMDTVGHTMQFADTGRDILVPTGASEQNPLPLFVTRVDLQDLAVEEQQHLADMYTGQGEVNNE